MSTYGRNVIPEGIHRNFPDTSSSGFSELETITNTGSSTKVVSRVRKIRRVHRNERGAAIGERRAVRPRARAVRPGARPVCRSAFSDIGGLPSAGGEQEVDARDDEEEEQQQDGHGRA